MGPENWEKYCRINQLHAEFQAIPTIAGSPGITMPTQKKFSTALFALAGSILGLAVATQATAQPASPAPAPGAAANAAKPAANPDVFVANAPDKHVVVKGDTLWDIAGKYLKQPWRWPQIWNMNREQIRNPHWIYPGQVIVLDKSTGTMRLSDSASAQTGTTTVILRPGIRAETPELAIPSIPAGLIEPFLTQPVLVDDLTMRDSPRVIASRDRVMMGSGDSIYVSGARDANITDYLIYRPGKTLRDPDDNSVLGHEATFVGSARVTRKGDPLTLQVTSSKLEISVGDRLIPAPPSSPINYSPHAPEQDVRGRIVSVYGGVAQAGRYQVVALSRGRAAGLEPGHVLALETRGRTIVDRTNGGMIQTKLPDERNGLMFVFRVFDKVAYALVMNVTQPVNLGDVFTRP